MAAKSVENHISADPKARPEINERNCTFFLPFVLRAKSPSLGSEGKWRQFVPMFR